MRKWRKHGLAGQFPYWRGNPTWKCYDSRRVAITLVELLVVISILTLLVSLMLPAVQNARESARRTHCQSNIKQIALAAIEFEGAKRRFPSGGWGYDWQGFPDIQHIAGQPGSWTYALLPFIEQKELYELGNFYDSPQDRYSALQQRLSSKVATYSCPTRRSGDPKPIDPNCVECATPRGTIFPLVESVRCDYAVNVGDGQPQLDSIVAWPILYAGPTDLNNALDTEKRKLWPKPPDDWTGISWVRTSIGITDITAGTSNTLLFGEKYVAKDAYNNGTDWGDNEPVYSGFNNDNHRGTHPFWPFLKDAAKKNSLGSFGSAHPQGANFAMTDGSVQHLSYSMEQDIFRRSGNRKVGAISPDD